MASHHLVKFVGYNNCGCGDIFLVVEGQVYTYNSLNPPLLFFL